MKFHPKRADIGNRHRLTRAGFLLAVVLVVCAGPMPWSGGLAAAAEDTHLGLNRASLEQVMGLPIPEEVARSIVNHRDFVRYYDNVYQLMEIEGVTPEIFARLKPLVSTMPPPEEDASIARLSASYRHHFLCSCLCLMKNLPNPKQ